MVKRVDVSLLTGSRVACALILAFVCCLVRAEDDLARLRTPLSKSEGIRVPQILIDVSEVGDDAKARAWANEAQDLCEDWFPVICRFLATEGWTPPETVELVLKKDLAVPGATTGNRIQCSLKWITEHPDDFGMVIHELTHVIQNYPNKGTRPGWLVEGVADYIRYWKYEPEIPRPRIDPERASYRQGYGVAADFLAYLTRKYDRRLVLRLDAALRTGAYKDDLFREITDKPLDDLWKEFAGQLRRS